MVIRQFAGMNPIIYIIASIILFITAPKDYSVVFCAICAVVFSIQSYRIVRLTNKVTHTGVLEFNLLFLLSVFAVVYVFPLFIYEVLSDYSFQHLSLFRDSAVNKVTALCTLAYAIYLYSYEYYFNRGLLHRSVFEVRIRVSKSSLSIIKVLAVLSLFVFSVNILFFTRTIDAQHNELTVNPYIAELTKCVLIICFICCCENNKEQLKNNPKALFHYCLVPISCLIIVIFEYLFIGDRGFIIVGGLTLLFVYNYYVSTIKTIIIVPVAIAAVVLMSLIGQLRKTDNSIREGGLSSFSSASSDIIETQSSWLEYISDLTLVSNVAYLEWDYTTEHSSFNPERLFIILSMPIPYAPTVLSSVLYGDSAKSTSTAYAVTEFYHSMVSFYGDGGLGTQAVLDLYMSWNILGVIIGMWLLGMLIGKSSVYRDYNIYYLIILITHFGLAIYLPRSTVYMCFRTVVWEIILLNLITKVEKTRSQLV